MAVKRKPVSSGEQKAPAEKPYRNEINRSAMALISPVKTWDVRERQVDVTINNRRYNLDAGSRYPCRMESTTTS
ncbi:hypothetical protein ACFSC4_29800 [Deinococcus malanensis]|uniref:hypothetical protein n=1 Tax=Deinococcus malanensis TaxID=1706855 RepID=UPI0036449556